MAYKEITSEFQGKDLSIKRQPVEIYRFNVSGFEWRHTSAEEDIVVGSDTYTPAALSRGTVTWNAALEVSEMQINTSHLTSIAQQYISAQPITNIWVEVRKLFRDQLPLSYVNSAVIFYGVIQTVSFQGMNATVNCVGYEFFFRQRIPTDRFQPQCNAFLFDSRCKLNPDTYKLTSTIEALFNNNTQLTINPAASFANDYFTLGKLKYQSDYRPIVYHTGSTIKLRYPFPALKRGDTIDMWPGCDLSIGTCLVKFNNKDNHRGFPYIPMSNPAMWTSSSKTL